jgi:hypothetical protein
MTTTCRVHKVVLEFLSTAILSVVLSVTILLLGSLGLLVHACLPAVCQDFFAVMLSWPSALFIAALFHLTPIVILAVVLGLQLSLWTGTPWVLPVLYGLVVGLGDAAFVRVRVGSATFRSAVDWQSTVGITIAFMLSALACWWFMRNWRSAERARS